MTQTPSPQPDASGVMPSTSGTVILPSNQARRARKHANGQVTYQTSAGNWVPAYGETVRSFKSDAETDVTVATLLAETKIHTLMNGIARWTIETFGTDQGLAEAHTGLPTDDLDAQTRNPARIALAALASGGVIDPTQTWGEVWNDLLDFADWDAPRI